MGVKTGNHGYIRHEASDGLPDYYKIDSRGEFDAHNRANIYCESLYSEWYMDLPPDPQDSNADSITFIIQQREETGLTLATEAAWQTPDVVRAAGLNGNDDDDGVTVLNLRVEVVLAAARRSDWDWRTTFSSADGRLRSDRRRTRWCVCVFQFRI